MKKVLFLIVFFTLTTSLFSQISFYDGRSKSRTKQTYVGNGEQSSKPLPVWDSVAQVTLRAELVTIKSRLQSIDSLLSKQKNSYVQSPKKIMNNTGFGDTLAYFWAYGRFNYIKAILRDTLNSRTDSIVFEGRDSVATSESERWFRIGATSTLDKIPYTVMVPGDGQKVMYIINAPTVYCIRARRINTYKPLVKTYINFIGSN